MPKYFLALLAVFCLSANLSQTLAEQSEAACNDREQVSGEKTMSSDPDEMNMFKPVSDEEFLAKLKNNPQSAMCLLPNSVTRIHRQTVAQLPCGFSLQADLYYRAQKPAKPRPALIFMHDWAGGKQPKICGDRQCNYFALQDDIFCVALYYRQPQDGRFPSALEDLRCCIRWLRSVAGEYAIDPEKIIVMGSSAGTQWTWLAAAANGTKTFDNSGGYQEFSGDVNLIVINAGICDFVKDFGQSGIGKAVMGGTASELPEKYRAASPLHQAHAGMPPALMIHGELDKTCPLSSAEAMAQRLRELGVPVDLVVRKGCGHGMGGFGADLHANLETIREFIRRHF